MDTQIFLVRDGPAILGSFEHVEIACEAARRIPRWQVAKPALPVLRSQTFPHKVYKGGFLVKNTYSADGNEFIGEYDVIPVSLFKDNKIFLEEQETVAKRWEHYKG